MIASPKEQELRVLVQSRQELDAALDQAVQQVRRTALASPPQGILVTRHAYSEFTVALSESVPYGEIRELVDF